MLFSGSFIDTEWAPDEKRECRFVFIGRNLDKKVRVRVRVRAWVRVGAFIGRNHDKKARQVPSYLR